MAVPNLAAFLRTVPNLPSLRIHHRRISCPPHRQLTMADRAPDHAPTLVTWDIDGTLLRAGGASGNAAHKRAIDEAVQSIYAISVGVNDVPHAGSTDRAIIRDMCLARGVSPDTTWKHMDEVMADASRRIAQYVENDLSHLVLPGVHDALSALRDRGAVLALTTGNFETCAWHKLKAARLDAYFVTGAFGSDCLLRTDILKLAMQRVRDLDTAFVFRERVGAAAFTNVFHVGDAVADMTAAREAGANGIGVLTGAFDRQQLEAERPLVVLDDLSDTHALLKLMGFDK